MGNQLFQIAAALSLAIDHDAEAFFPQYQSGTKEGIPLNRRYVYTKINKEHPVRSVHHRFREDRNFHFVPIPFLGDMEICGYFQSERYFQHNWEKIYPYFAPSEQIVEYLQKKYPFLCAHPETVALHVRSYLTENSALQKVFAKLDLRYFEQAASLFSEEALFVVFSDNINHAKRLLRDFSRPHLFVEKEAYYHDFYLMSMMKHQIISNSTFSWWAAYLNRNPSKKVVAPDPWFHPTFSATSAYIVPESWIKIPVRHIDE